jgi:mannose-1-phosphate guanylyltransferase/mannose-6-phosphate isomerase
VIVPVILCGGGGLRLWPASREDSPKPFLPLVGGDSTFDLTLARVADRTLFAEPVIVAGAEHAHLVAASLAKAGATATILLEPVSRDTAPAIAAAAAFVAARAPDAIMLSLPADHVIRDAQGFRDTIAAALPAAEAGNIVVFGVRPAGPATSYGYVQPGAAASTSGARSVAAFVEKPDAGHARQFIAAGYLWNSGIFLMRAATLLDEMEKHAPAVARAAQQAVAAPATNGERIALDKDSFSAAQKIAIDHAVMEKTRRAVVVDAAFDWADLGTWSSVWEAAARDSGGNVALGDAVLVGATNSYLSSPRPKVAVFGVSDAVVVATDDAVLVTSRAQADRVKDVAAAIQAKPEALFGDFARHYRPWGYYQSLDQGRRHQVKRIVVNPGARLSLQKHSHRAEHWTVVDGIADVTVGMDRDSLKVTRVNANEAIEIPLGAIHRMANPGATPMTLIEVQVGDYLGEDDIVRLEDDYGR